MRRRSHCTSASNWDSEAWKFSHTERWSYACALRYVAAKFYYSNSRPHKCRTRNYVSTSAENGPAMAGPAGPVPAPMWLYDSGVRGNSCVQTSCCKVLARFVSRHGRVRNAPINVKPYYTPPGAHKGKVGI